MAGTLWLVYLNVLNILIVATAFVILVSGLDDLVIDISYWSSEFYRRFVRGIRHPATSIEALRAREERWFAVMVPAWQEADVIAHMIENTLETLEYTHYVVFLGTYQNDPATCAEVNRMVARDPVHIRRAPVRTDGPTCKADCLNWILRDIVAYESEHRMRFVGVLMHDCEDVIHPLEIKYFNSQIDTHDLIQLPVASLDLAWTAFVAGTYLDDFSEVHQKDVVVRQRLTGLVPGAGVALCYRRNAIAAAMKAHQNHAFNTATLTEDYDFSFRLAELGFTRQMFARFPLQVQPVSLLGSWWQRPVSASGLLATCEYFPSKFRAAYRQRARWILGIAFLGWQQLRWRGDFWNKYMLFRDRKGIVTAPFSMLAYLVLANALAVTVWGNRIPGHGAPHDLVIFHAWLQPILIINTALLANRLFERVYFVTRMAGFEQGLLSIPRMVLNNFINFAAVSRAWHLFVVHLVTGAAIAWDKTAHTFPTGAELAHHRRRLGELLLEHGIITPSDLEWAVARQRETGAMLGQTLIEAGRLTPEFLADTLAEQAQLPRARQDAWPEMSLAGVIPRELMLGEHVVPLARDSDDTLQVAISGMPDPRVTQRIHATTGLQVAYVVARDDELARWVAASVSDDMQLHDSRPTR